MEKKTGPVRTGLPISSGRLFEVLNDPANANFCASQPTHACQTHYLKGKQTNAENGTQSLPCVLKLRQHL